MLKMYIAILDEAPDYMVPTLVAHSAINAHIFFTSTETYEHAAKDYATYQEWLKNSFRKVVVKVNRKEYDKIANLDLEHWEGYENTICNGQGSCLVVLPVDSDNIPNVLKYAKLWKPKEAV